MCVTYRNSRCDTLYQAKMLCLPATCVSSVGGIGSLRCERSREEFALRVRKPAEQAGVAEGAVVVRC